MLTVNSNVVGLNALVNSQVANSTKLAMVVRGYAPTISYWHPQGRSCLSGKPQFTVGKLKSIDTRASMRDSRRQAHGSAVL